MKIVEAQYEEFFPPEVVKLLKSKSVDSRKKMLGNQSLGQIIAKTSQLLDSIGEIEGPYIPQLEKLAVDLVKEAYPIIDDQNIKIIAKIGSPPVAPDDELIPITELPETDMSEDEKRRIINGITQGSSIRGAYAINLFGDALDQMDGGLVQKYNELLNSAFGIYDDEQAIAMMLAMLAQQKKVAGGESEGGYDEENDELVIKAWGLNFPFLVHEIIKGLYELISLSGFSADKEKNQQVADRVDQLENEPDDFRFGKFIYDAINDLYINSEYDDPRMREYLLQDIYKLEVSEFKTFILNLIQDKLTSDQTQWVKNALRDIYNDLKKDDTGLTGLGEQFIRMNKLAGLLK
jgi:hypothetical protein